MSRYGTRGQRSAGTLRKRLVHAALALSLAAGAGMWFQKWYNGTGEIIDRTPEPAPTTRPSKSLEHYLAASKGDIENLPHYAHVARATDKHAAREGLTYRAGELEQLTYAVISRESQFDGLAVGDAGEVGLMQVLYDDVRAKYGPQLAAVQARHPQRHRRGPDRDAYVREVKPIKDAIRRDYASRFSAPHNINAGIRYLTECGAHAEQVLGHARTAHMHNAEDDLRWRKLTAAYYNAGQHGVDSRITHLPAPMRMAKLSRLQELGTLNLTTRQYIAHVDGSLQRIREHYGPPTTAPQRGF